MDIFCTSEASTAMDQPPSSSSSSSAVLLGGGSSSPAIDRCNPIITDSRRSAKQPPLPPPPLQLLALKNRKKKVDEANTSTSTSKKSWSCSKPGDFTSPPGSARYLLTQSQNQSQQPHASSPVQVVVLRVSLHCRGCEKKMRKHISRMEGVKSFNIDFLAKKVTVTGNVTPLEVVASISKVKNAQLWSPSAASPINNNSWAFAGISS